jgi:hypothetical protein
MTLRQTTYRIFLPAFIPFLFFHFAVAQAVKTEINTNHILIGEQIKYEVKINLANSSYQIAIDIPDSVPHFEIINQNKYDTTDANGVYTLRQNIVFTSFDSGVWKIPSFPISISLPGKATQKFASDSFLVQVGYSPADSTGQLRDIKPVIEVFVIDRQWMYITGAVLLALILLFFLYRYFKNRKKKTVPLFNASLSPFDEAMKALHQLQQQTATEPGELKQFYITLSDIFKKYYSRKMNKNLMSETTGELLLQLQEYTKTPETVSAAAQALRCGDAVKFAKYLPPAAENLQSVSQIKMVIEQMEKKSGS